MHENAHQLKVSLPIQNYEDFLKNAPKDNIVPLLAQKTSLGCHDLNVLMAQARENPNFNIRDEFVQISLRNLCKSLHLSQFFPLGSPENAHEEVQTSMEMFIRGDVRGFSGCKVYWDNIYTIDFLEADRILEKEFIEFEDALGMIVLLDRFILFIREHMRKQRYEDIENRIATLNNKELIQLYKKPEKTNKHVQNPLNDVVVVTHIGHKNKAWF